MKNIVTMLAIVGAAVMASAPAYAGLVSRVPEPVSMSLLAGGVVAIAAVRHLRRK